MSNRLSNGERVNQWGRPGGKRGMGNISKVGDTENKDRPSHIEMTKGSVFGNTQTSGGRRPDGTTKKPYFNGHPRGHTKRLADGSMDVQTYNVPAMANPGTYLDCREDDIDDMPSVLDVSVGGGHMGHEIAHLNEAPYPVGVPEFFIKSLCPPGGLVVDPFSGSGTTLDAARRNGRIGIGFDLRMSQCDLARRRMTEPPSSPKPKKQKAAPEEPNMFATAA